MNLHYRPHDGGPCPVDEGTMVACVLRGKGAIYFDFAGNMRWEHAKVKNKHDVMSYAILGEEQEQ